MLELLLEKDRKEIKKEYLFRFLNIYFIFLIVVFTAGFIAIIPTFYLVSFQNKTADESIQQFKKSESTIKQKVLEEEARNLADDVKISQRDAVRYSDFIKIIEEASIESVEINSIVFKQIKNSETQKIESIIIDIGGAATQRKLLVNFVASLEKLNIFKKVDMPLSNLTKEADLLFNIRVETEMLIVK